MKNKKVLVVSYSQTGQLSDLVSHFTKPLESDENIEVDHKIIKPLKKFPFPWDVVSFMDAFPESVYLDGCEIESLEEDDKEYDLVIIAYSIWFLSPSIPIAAFMKSNWAKKKLNGKPIITLIGCRNMWIMAQEKMKQLISDVNGTLIDNVVLIDQGKSYETFFTTTLWMLTGRKNFFSKLTPAGLCATKVSETKRFGKAIVEALDNDKEKEKKSLLYGLKAVYCDIRLINGEKIATHSFSIWGGWIRKLGKQGDKKRVPLVLFYMIFLIILILTVVPINMLIQVIRRKINKNTVAKQKALYEQPSGNGDERLKEFL